MIDGYLIRRLTREYDRKTEKSLKTLEGYAYSLGIITDSWDDLDNEFSGPNHWETMLSKL